MVRVPVYMYMCIHEYMHVCTRVHIPLSFCQGTVSLSHRAGSRSYQISLPLYRSMERHSCQTKLFGKLDPSGQVVWATCCSEQCTAPSLIVLLSPINQSPIWHNLVSPCDKFCVTLLGQASYSVKQCFGYARCMYNVHVSVFALGVCTCTVNICT